MYTKRQHSVEKCFLPWSEEIMPPQEFLRKSKRDTRTKNKEFLGSLLNQDLEPNVWPKFQCKCPNFSKLASIHKAPKPDSSQDKQNTTPDNIPVTVGIMQAQK